LTFILFLNIRQNLYISPTYFRKYKIQERFQNVVCTRSIEAFGTFDSCLIYHVSTCYTSNSDLLKYKVEHEVSASLHTSTNTFYIVHQIKFT